MFALIPSMAFVRIFQQKDAYILEFVLRCFRNLYNAVVMLFWFLGFFGAAESVV